MTMSAVLSPDAFATELRRRIEKRRTFGTHPLWQRMEAGELEQEGLRLWARQFYLQVVEFPRAVSALHARCEDPGLRRKLAESLYEEETGLLSGCGVPHPVLFARLAAAVGVSDEHLQQERPLPATAALLHWFQVSTQLRTFLDGIAAINLAAEGQVPGAFARMARALATKYQLSTEAVAFFDVHDVADREHADVGDHAVVRLAATPEAQQAAIDALETSLATWWAFYDGIERAIVST